MKPRAVDQRLVDDAIALRKQGRTQGEIAAELKVAQATISIVLRAHGWGGIWCRSSGGRYERRLAQGSGSDDEEFGFVDGRAAGVGGGVAATGGEAGRRVARTITITRYGRSLPRRWRCW